MSTWKKQVVNRRIAETAELQDRRTSTAEISTVDLHTLAPGPTPLHYSCFILSARHLGHSHYLADIVNVIHAYLMAQMYVRDAFRHAASLSGFPLSLHYYPNTVEAVATVRAMHVPSRAAPSNKKSAVIPNGHALSFWKYSVVCLIR